jgi:hypothetical protein
MLFIVYRKADAGQRHYLSPVRLTYCGLDTSVPGWDVDIKGGLATCEACLFAVKVLESDASDRSFRQELGMKENRKEVRDRRITEFLLEHDLKEALSLVDELVREHEISIQTKVDEATGQCTFVVSTEQTPYGVEVAPGEGPTLLAAFDQHLTNYLRTL